MCAGLQPSRPLIAGCETALQVVKGEKLYARLGRGDSHDSSLKWRCYAAGTLNKDKTAYQGGAAYCSHDAELEHRLTLAMAELEGKRHRREFREQQLARAVSGVEKRQNSEEHQLGKLGGKVVVAGRDLNLLDGSATQLSGDATHEARRQSEDLHAIVTLDRRIAAVKAKLAAEEGSVSQQFKAEEHQDLVDGKDTIRQIAPKIREVYALEQKDVHAVASRFSNLKAAMDDSTHTIESKISKLQRQASTKKVPRVPPSLYSPPALRAALRSLSTAAHRARSVNQGQTRRLSNARPQRCACRLRSLCWKASPPLPSPNRSPDCSTTAFPRSNVAPQVVLTLTTDADGQVHAQASPMTVSSAETARARTSTAADQERRGDAAQEARVRLARKYAAERTAVGAHGAPEAAAPAQFATVWTQAKLKQSNVKMHQSALLQQPAGGTQGSRQGVAELRMSSLAQTSGSARASARAAPEHERGGHAGSGAGGKHATTRVGSAQTSAQQVCVVCVGGYRCAWRVLGRTGVRGIVGGLFGVSVITLCAGEGFRCVG